MTKFKLGHSMGGVLSRLMVSSSGGKYILARKFIEADEEGGIWKAWDLEDNKIYCFKESREQYYFAIKDGMVTEYTRKQITKMFGA